MGGESAHLHELAEEIGPRPATTDAEAHAADYIERVFHSRGLEVDRQEFNTPRTYSWAFVLYHLLTIVAAVLVVRFPLPALILGVVVAVLLWTDLDTRWGLSAIMPKGPSQNIVAKHVPRTFRGERTRKVVVVAHYDSARASLAFSPGLVRNFSLTFGLMKWCTYLVPVLVFVRLLLVRLVPAAAKGATARWSWYAILVVAAYLLVPLFINLHRELFMKPTPGANDNASGVAAMLGVMERILPEPEGGYETVSMPAVEPVRHSEEDAWAADVVPEDTLLTYTPASVEPRVDLDEDIDWGEPSPSRDQKSLFDQPAQPTSQRRRPATDDWGAGEWTGEMPAVSGERAERAAREEERAEEGGGEKKRGVRDWLGLGGDFDVRKEGRKIGSWDQFPEGEGGDDDDDFGWKGGAAGEDYDDPGFASAEAHRIRTKVTSSVDRDLAEKEVWFVATGAEEVGTWGMKAFLDEHRDELRDAFIINIDNVGAGTIAYVTSEGMARRYHCDRRLMAAAKRFVRENELPYRGRDYHGLSTDATPALARGFRAMSIMAFDINGRLPNWHWNTDTVENVQIETVEKAADLVTGIIRDL